MIYVCIPVALMIGFVLGHAYAVWRRRCFIQSLMPANSEHTDFDEPDDESFGVGRSRVRRGARGLGVHSQSSTYPEARNHVR
jgi:hypothetical protein